MTKKEYLEIREDSSKDTAPIYYFLWELEGKQSLSSAEFYHYFWHWVFSGARQLMFPSIQHQAFQKLDKHFGV